MRRDVADAILEWARDTETLLDACRQLVEYYGTDDEAEAYRKGTAVPLWWVRKLRSIALGESGDAEPLPQLCTFSCAKSVAEALSPLLRIVVEWEPCFLYDVRQTSENGEAKEVVRTYGLFRGPFASFVCAPIWKAYPELAPPGWPL